MLILRQLTLCFLNCNIIIMPEGIGNAYEKWKIDRLRKQAEEKSNLQRKLVHYYQYFLDG